MKVTLLMTTLVLLTTQVRQIKIMKTDNSPGILPFRLGKAYIKSNKHISLQEMDL